MQFQNIFEGTRSTRQLWTSENRLFPRLCDRIAEHTFAGLLRHARQASTSRWLQICRWQTGMMTTWQYTLIALGYAVLLHVLESSTASAHPGPPAPFKTASFVTSVLLLMPAMMSLTGFLQRRPMMEREIMMPIDRTSYIRQLGTAAALNQVRAYGAFAFVFLLWWAVHGSYFLPVSMLLQAILLCLAFQFAFFGVVTWTSRYRSRWLTGLMMMPLVFIAQFIAYGLSRMPSFFQLFGVALAVIAVSLLITFDAYRRWLRMDFD